MITNAPTGISWSIIPFPKSTSAQQFAEQVNMCWRATAIVDGYVNQIFRSTIDNEERSGPGEYRINIEQSTGNIRWILSRYPITQILAVQVAPNTFPRQWQPVGAGYYDIENPVIGVYGSSAPGGSGSAGGQSILISAGYGGWWNGRNGFRFLASYINGWPHAGLTASADAGVQVLTVDDVTGMAGAAVMIYDGANTESVTVSSVTANANIPLPNGVGTAPAGPGTLQLASPTLFPHTGSLPASVVVSALPGDVIWATVLATTVQALESGITAVTTRNLPGSQTVGGQGIQSLEKEYMEILKPYRRVI